MTPHLSPAVSGTAAPLTVLVAHNAYQLRGGEDAVVDAEIALLREAGHRVVEYRRHNDEIDAMPRAALALRTLWNHETVASLGALLERTRPDVVHVHNTFPLISPALYDVCRDRGVPIVQTLHNFRLACPNGTLLREQRPCEACVGRVPWRAVVHRCYRDSAIQSSVLSASLIAHRVRGTMARAVQRYIALSAFARAKFIEMGLPADRIDVKPNFVSLTPLPPTHEPRRGLLYVGRLSVEKGVGILAQALASNAALEARIAGTGPEGAALAGLPHADRLGALPPQAVMPAMATAIAVVMPSLCYEGFPRALAEAFASATPVIASRIGALAELVEHGVTGLLVPAGDAQALADAMAWAQQHPDRMREMGERAHSRYLEAFTPAHNLPRLLAIYRSAIASRTEPAAHRAAVPVSAARPQSAH